MDIKENKKTETKQTLFLVLGIFLVSLFIIGGTYAYMTLSIDINNNVIAYNTTCFNIVYDADNDTTPITGTLIPSSGPTGGLNGKISIGLAANCTNIDANGTFNLNITNGSDILFQVVDAHCENSQTLRTLTKYSDRSSCETVGGKWVTNGTALKYAIYTTDNITSTTVPVKTGYLSFNGLISLYQNFSVLNETVNYYFYIWLDGNLVDNTYASQSIVANISTSVSQSSGSNPNAPELDPGMIPVTISNDGTVKTISPSNSSWYNYSNKQWANAVLVNETSRSNYLGTTGKTITQSDILAYYVWIPRYKYRITGKCSAVSSPTIEANSECYGAPYMMSDTDKSNFIEWLQQSMIDAGAVEYTTAQATSAVDNALATGMLSLTIGEITENIEMSVFVEAYNDENNTPITYTSTFNGNNTTLGPNPIDIVFEPKDVTKSTGDAVGTYYTHPAFTWNGNNIGGIWVGKFETTGDAATPTILPNISSLRNSQNVSTQFTTSLKFSGGTLSNGNVTFAGNNIYGLISTTDSHMMKNSEWGAAAYLSHSQYGINDEVRINNNSKYTTGCGASEANGSSTSTCEIAYGSGVASYPQSTTGNITGIFDMSGGGDEQVMGVYSDSTGNPRSGISSSYNSGFNGLLGDGTTYSSGISFPNSKYYDLYLSSQFTGDSRTNMSLCTLETCGGHALNETAGWYLDNQIFVYANEPWFKRGGNFFDAGVFFLDRSDGSSRDNGTADFDLYSWRSVLVVDGA